jgi:hypothetical protein
MDIDLDIFNYNYRELLNIYGLSFDYNKNNVDVMKNKIKLIKTNFDNDIYSFFIKVYKIISIIYKLYEFNIISNMDNHDLINCYLNEIRFKKYYENNDLNFIIDNLKLLNKNNYNNKYTFTEDTEKPTYDNSVLNDIQFDTKYYTPSLNNKNKTNLINNSFPNVVAPGSLNSVKRITQYQNLYLNSCFRHNYYNSNPCDFQYIIPSEIKNVLSMRLVSIEIPNAWYLFSKITKNNSFIIEIHICGKIKSYNIIVPDGNYDIDTLQNYLNSKYFYESDTESELKYLKFYIDPYNFKSNFVIIENCDCEFTFTFTLIFLEEMSQNLMNTFGWTLGFRLAKYIDIEDKVESEGLYDGGGDRYIYVCINDYQYNNNNINIVGFDKSILNEDVIAKIPMVNGKLSLIIDDNSNLLTKTRRYNGPVTISKLQIKILDRFGSIINLNNMDYSFTLEIETLYENFNFSNVSY